MKRTILKPQGFKYWKYVYRRLIPQPVPMPREIPKELEYYCAATGYRERIHYPSDLTEDVIDISIEVPDDIDSSQYVRIVLYPNKYTQAKEEREFIRTFYLGSTFHNGARTHLEYMRNRIVSETLIEGE